ncbi:MAG: GNAT family N-acetyltransferase [Treponema sp.]|jgi:predicted acetyltransferase|nr:GNAT family N-acetyltransferase [Treponema sp.]
MYITIEPIQKEEKEILKNLLEKYNYEFSQYDDIDVNNLGLFGYDYLDSYWTEENRYPFFIKVDGKLAGFVLINDHPEIKIETNYSVAEFFVVYKYRKHGVGKYAAKYILNKFKGKWQVKVHPKNKISEHFWRKIIDEYTNGNYEFTENVPTAVCVGGALGHVFVFET